VDAAKDFERKVVAKRRLHSKQSAIRSSRPIGLRIFGATKLSSSGNVVTASSPPGRC
jgi:hypothetical protein